jgi:hypothetical protein
MPTIKSGVTPIDGGKTKTKGYTVTPTKKAAAQTISPLKPLANTAGNAPGGPQYAASPSPTATAASTSGSGGSTPPPGLPASGSNPYTGFASRYNPAALQSQIWQDPQMVLNSMYQDAGKSLSSPMYSTLRDFYGADPQSLYLLMQGNKPGAYESGGTGNAGSYANFLNSLYGNQMTPGGRGISFSEILGNLNGVGDESSLSAQQQSPLYQLLTSGGASDQVRSLYGLLGDAAKTSLSPAIASAFMNALAKQSDSYLTANGTTQGGAVPYYQYFQNPMQSGQ